MLVIDFAFFVLELGVGVYVGSLALMADAFHMVCWPWLLTNWTLQADFNS
jgi:hypothetical protein